MQNPASERSDSITKNRSERVALNTRTTKTRKNASNAVTNTTLCSTTLDAKVATTVSETTSATASHTRSFRGLCAPDEMSSVAVEVPSATQQPYFSDYITTRELTKTEVKEACIALNLKLRRDKQGRRQYRRRLKKEPYRLSDTQKNLFANTYKAARNDARPIDYVRLSRSYRFSTFLATLENDIIDELKEALIQQREIEAGKRTMTSVDWVEELARCQVLHQNEVAEIEFDMKKLEQRLATVESNICDLRIQLACMETENRQLRDKRQLNASNRHDVASCQESMDARVQEMQVFKERLRQQEEDQARKHDEIVVWSPNLSQLRLGLDQNQEGLVKQASELADERRRLDIQLPFQERNRENYQYTPLNEHWGQDV